MDGLVLIPSFNFLTFPGFPETECVVPVMKWMAVMLHVVLHAQNYCSPCSLC